LKNDSSAWDVRDITLIRGVAEPDRRGHWQPLDPTVQSFFESFVKIENPCSPSEGMNIKV
jgi:hypothetical protein